MIFCLTKGSNNSLIKYNIQFFFGPHSTAKNHHLQAVNAVK